MIGRLRQLLERRDEVGHAFQPDAIELEGRQPPLGTHAVLYALVALIVIALIWAAVSKVDIIVAAQGKLVTDAQTVVVQPLETSVIRTIDVRVGQLVKKGEVIATLDPTFAEADVAQVKQRIASLNAEIARLEAEQAEKPYKPQAGSEDAKLQFDLYEKRAAEHQSRVAGLRADMARYEADLKGTQRTQLVLKDRLDSLKQIENMKSNLKDQKYVSPMSVLESKEKRLEVEADYEAAVNKGQQLEEQIRQARSALDTFTRGWRQKTVDDLVKAGRERDALTESLSKAERRSALVELRAPIDATVLELNKRSVGSVAKEAEPIATLVPQGVPLQAEIQIPADEIGFVRKNDPVRIKIDAFPFQRHGTVDGTLTAIGEDSFVADGGSRGRPMTKAFYPARVSDLKSDLKKVPTDTRLTPGMTLVAEIKVSERSVLSYFVYPLVKAFDEGIREP
jgi:HlyD family secretion protein